MIFLKNVLTLTELVNRNIELDVSLYPSNNNNNNRLTLAAVDTTVKPTFEEIS